jgi:UDP-N-acetylmuramate: L-alanyl-gamma-D-glutamyl-meso-diaminopimelate ligase
VIRLVIRRIFIFHSKLPHSYQGRHRSGELLLIPLYADAHVHLIAACGTAMGSLAGMLCHRGYRVTGSDTHVYPPMSDFLRDEGIEILSGYSADHVHPAPDLVIVGNAISRGNPELEAVLDSAIPYAHLPEVLRDMFLPGRQPLVVSGTHGKTTTTALVAHLLRTAGADPSWLVAGLPRDLPRPYHLGDGDWFVLEGDEYDSAYFAKFAKFLFYRPHLLIVNNIEFDHADIFRDLDEIQRAFRQVVNQVPQSGLVLAGGDDPIVTQVTESCLAPVQTFGLGAGNDWRAVSIRQEDGFQSFELIGPEGCAGRMRLGMSGEHNLRNAVGALAATAFAGYDPATLATALESFVGVRRRQELLGTIKGVTLIDDFAHHPTAVAQTLAGLRQAQPDRRLWSVFEPASSTNSRATFEEDYLEAFCHADAVIIGSVPRPERSRDDEPFSPERLARNLRNSGTAAWSLDRPERIVSHLVRETAPGDLVVFMSNAGFGGVQQATLAALTEQSHG